MASIVIPAAMLVAMGLDRIVGQPPHRLHPVVGIGRYLQWAGRRLPALPPALAFAGGVLAWMLGAVPLVAVAWALQAGTLRAFDADVSADGSVAAILAVVPAAVPAAVPVAVRAAVPAAAPAAVPAAVPAVMPSAVPVAVLAAVLGMALHPMLAWRMLHDEVAAVQRALSAGLEPARERVGRLVSRDTAALDAVQVRETAIETLAENLNDSVVAPLFWFAVAGLPGAVLYRYANTADAMWGYRGRWEWAGKWAARVDDVLSWLPARLTALALLPWPARWSALIRQARRTPSPNGGWPMGAMALALGVRLGKPGVYLLNAEGRETTAADVDDALRRAGRALWPTIVSLLALAFALRVSD